MCFFFFLLLMSLLVTEEVIWAGEVKLPALVVTATRTPHTLEDVPLETVVIDRKEIESRNSLSVSELLRYVPGFFVRAENLPGVSAWRTRLRGFDLNSGYALILVDGQRVRGGGMGEYGWGLNQIPPSLIEKIEIVKGPGSVLYGSDAVTGVINIITRRIPEKPFLEGLLRGGSHDTAMFDLTGGSALGKHAGLLLAIDHEETDRRKYGGPGDHYERDHFFGKLSLKLSDNLDLLLSLKGEDRDRNFADEEKIRIAPRLSYQAGKGQIDLSGYYYRWDFHHFTPGYTERKGKMYYRQAEIKISFPLGPQLFTLGGELREEELDYNLAEKTIEVRSFYAQDEVSFNTHGHEGALVLGTRVDDHSTFGSEWSPRGAIFFKLSESLRLRAQVGKSFKSPTIRQLYYREPFLHHDYWIKSNPHLEAETSWGKSVSLEKLWPRGSLTLTFFRHDLDDMVVRVETEETIEGYPVRTYENVEEAYSQGVELAALWRPLKILRLDLSYTYLDTENKDTKKDLPYSPRHTLGIRGSLFLPEGWSLHLGTQYVDEAYANTSNTRKIDSYWLTEAKLRKQFSKIEFFVEVDNLFETNYGEPTRKWTGRTVFVGFRSKLSFKEGL